MRYIPLTFSTSETHSKEALMNKTILVMVFCRMTYYQVPILLLYQKLLVLFANLVPSE